MSVEGFAVQNWLITPAALAVKQAPPQNVSSQSWMLHLSGVALLNLTGTADWRRESLTIAPNLEDPLNYAIKTFSIPRPPAREGIFDFAGFQVQQEVLFAAISSIFNQNESINSGFSVDTWGPLFRTENDSFSGQSRGKIFEAINADVAVRDVDATLFRVSYNISLLGQIVFCRQYPVL